MARWSGLAVRHRRLPLVAAAALALAVAGTFGTFAASPQLPAPYQLFPRTDCELTSEYFARTNTTSVRLAITPPGPDKTPSAASLLLWAQYPGTEPAGPPDGIVLVALPSVTSNPNVIRSTQMELTLEGAGPRPVRLFYVGASWARNGFLPPGAEVRGVEYQLSIAELEALLLAEQVTGRVMNYRFVLGGKHLAALHQFASAIGVADPANTRPNR